MRRRALLGSAVAATAALAGCSTIQSQLGGGDGGEQNAQIQELQSTIEEKDQRISELETRVEELETNNERFKQAAEREEKLRIVARYADALKLRNEANDGWNQGIQSYQAQEFEDARFKFARTSGVWNSAGVEFANAGTTAENQEQPQVQQFCTAARNFCAVMSNAATQFSQASNLYAKGNIEQGNAAVQEAQSTKQDANDHNVATLKEVESALNLG